MKVIAILGASGYIGRHLVAHLILHGGYRVKVLSRKHRADLTKSEWPSGVNVCQGDMQDLKSLQMFLEPNCIVVNLVYLWESGESVNLAVTKNLLSACKDAQVERLIHCSTAAVVGRVAEDKITEGTACRPISEYGITKLKVEKLIVAAAAGFDTVVLRPTGVFGIGGEPLKKLAGDLATGSPFKNYLKSCLFGKRRMNLVHISNVVAAVTFLIDRIERLNGQVFIVSDDNALNNNFADIELKLMGALGSTGYAFPRIPMPSGLLKFFLFCLKRNNINPGCNYIQDKLERLGFESPVTFNEGLEEYASWYRATIDAGLVEVSS